MKVPELVLNLKTYFGRLWLFIGSTFGHNRRGNSLYSSFGFVLIARGVISAALLIAAFGAREAPIPILVGILLAIELLWLALFNQCTIGIERHVRSRIKTERILYFRMKHGIDMLWDAGLVEGTTLEELCRHLGGEKAKETYQAVRKASNHVNCSVPFMLEVISNHELLRFVEMGKTGEDLVNEIVDRFYAANKNNTIYSVEYD